MRGRRAIPLLLALGGLLLATCAEGGAWWNEDGWPPTGDGDSDSDVEPDRDAGIGEDADTDSPTSFACPDGEGQCEDGLNGTSGECAGGDDDDLDGLVDCADPGCFGAPVCCARHEGSWVAGEFELCESLEACGFRTFSAAGDGSAVRIEGAEVLLGGDGSGEVGLYSEALFGLSGEPTVVAVASFDPSRCTATSCRQALGLALTAQAQPSSGTGVSPFVGLVVDGEQGAVHFFVAGRREATVPLPAETLVAPRAYGFRVAASGEVRFWAGLDLTSSGAIPTLDDAAPAYSRAGAVTDAPAALRLAAFARAEGDGAAHLSRLRLGRQVCDVPAGWERVTTGPVVTSPRPFRRLGRPSVVARPGGGFLMVLEADSGLAVSESADGETWSTPRPILTGPPSTTFGRVAMRSPALLDGLPGEEPPRLHLWYEGEGETSPDSPLGAPPVAILHAVSDDGLAWSEADPAVAIDHAPGPGAAAQPREPAAVVSPDEGVLLFFVGRSPESGETAVYRATSPSGEGWNVWDEPLPMTGAEAASFEADGVGQPVVARHRGALHLWYEGRSGARSAIGYAVSGDEGASWQRQGLVLEASPPWESRRVRGPAVAAVPAEVTGVERLLLWFEAGPPGLEQIGLATRLAPRD